MIEDISNTSPNQKNKIKIACRNKSWLKENSGRSFCGKVFCWNKQETKFINYILLSHDELSLSKRIYPLSRINLEKKI
jgi:hypothetical protein